jgi:hypothetical protein
MAEQEPDKPAHRNILTKPESMKNIHSIASELATFTQKAFPDAKEINDIVPLLMPFLCELEQVTLERIKKCAPSPNCESFHHSPKDRHAADEPCPCVHRFNAALGFYSLQTPE